MFLSMLKPRINILQFIAESADNRPIDRLLHYFTLRITDDFTPRFSTQKCR